MQIDIIIYPTTALLVGTLSPLERKLGREDFCNTSSLTTNYK
ncbi:hypothetical protein M072_4249 [Bacteroides fragilis str. DS-208]|nr:hypothetical protein M072_4249 [Bacteroides fragilis str. DS-208]